jgi:hypothetical protein
MEKQHDPELAALLEERAKISKKLNDYLAKKFTKYEQMTTEVKDDNPYR